MVGGLQLRQDAIKELELARGAVYVRAAEKISPNFNLLFWRLYVREVFIGPILPHCSPTGDYSGTTVIEYLMDHIKCVSFSLAIQVRQNLEI